MTTFQEPPSATSIRAWWAKRLVREKLAAELNAIREKRQHLGISNLNDGFMLPDVGTGLEEPYTYDSLPHDHDRGQVDGVFDDIPARKLCIVGTGVAGLYIAMILDSLKIPGLTYDILEANPKRVGGRVYTHHFSKDPHDYYDIGAMRFPMIDTMDRVFKLFDLTKVLLIPYYLDATPKPPQLFNDSFFVKDAVDPYKVGKKNGGSVPDDVADRVGDILKLAFGPYKDKLAANFNKGFDDLMKVDDYSTREFLKRPHPRWMKTQNTSTNLFDQAFSESVIDSFDFDYPTKKPDDDVEWRCIEGGTSLLTDTMRSKLSTQVQLGKRVEAISIDRKNKQEANMSVKCADEDQPRTGYSTVFSTTTLACLGRMDLRTLDLHPTLKDAIRSLHYDDSVKVAIKFSYPWWIFDCGITSGGVASTDLPLRTCVYPSYNLHDGADKPAVLLASYTWAQDATRVGSLVGTPAGEEELIELILRNLARLHAQHSNISYEKIKKSYLNAGKTHHAYSWSHDRTMGGAFALFGPGQFSNLYPYLARPAADSKFHIVGEASSAHHAWIVGALDSAFASVYRFLKNFRLNEAIEELERLWGSVQELEGQENGTVHLQL